MYAFKDLFQQLIRGNIDMIEEGFYCNYDLDRVIVPAKMGKSATGPLTNIVLSAVVSEAVDFGRFNSYNVKP